MKDRIAHILRAKNLTATEFADSLGIQRSGISHLLAGRNKPSLDFIMKLKETFPEYNLDWLIMGKGPITVSEPFKEPTQKSDLLFEHPSDLDELDEKQMNNDTAESNKDFTIEMPNKVPVSSRGALKRIILVYDDNSFEELFPK